MSSDRGREETPTSDTALQGVEWQGVEWHSPKVAEIAPGFSVKRVLPFRGGRGVGPFIFLDHMGPAERVVSGAGDVGPHPHIGLATITYLFSGEFMHRDSLGSVQRIKPGEVNWMTAGRGIVHSERAPQDQYGEKQTLHGLQIWVALPENEEECEPRFQHASRDELPAELHQGLQVTWVVGEWKGKRSPVLAQEGLLYLSLDWKSTGDFEFALDSRPMGLYLVEGEVEVSFAGAKKTYSAPGLLRFSAGLNQPVQIRSNRARAIWIGGPELQSHRRIWWNFVSTRKERIEQAKQEWREDRFPKIPGETERIPLPAGSEKTPD